MTAHDDATWWGRYPLAEGEMLEVRLGPLQLWIERRAREWVLRYRHGLDPLADVCSVDVTRTAPDDDGGLVQSRYAVAPTDAHIELLPTLSDRPMVVAVETRLFLPPGQETLLHLSTPLSVRLRDGAGVELTRIPTVLPQETWFGPSPTRGVIADAARTRGRLELGDLTQRRHRAVTTVELRNHGRDAMAIESLQVPLPQLALYRLASDGSLRTSGVTMERDSTGATGRMLVDTSAPSPDGERLAPPQQATGSNVLHALSALFG